MARLDDRLREDLERAARPADPSGLYEDLIRRRERRRVRHRVQAGGLALVVVAGTVLGVAGLARVFGGGSTPPELRPVAPSPKANGVLAYTTGDAIRIQEADGTAARTIPPPAPGLAWHIAWSPRGDRLAVAVFGDADRSLWVMEADGADPVLLIEADNVSRPSWHPDGEHLVFSVTDEGLTEVHVMRSDGSDDRVIYSEDARGTYAVFSATFSPDGSQVVFDAGTDSGYDIFVMDADGSNVLQVTRTGTDYNPSWSPDGKEIVFTRQEAASESDIFVMDADGSNVRRLTDDGADFTNLDPQFSPDGTLITYEAAKSGGVGPVMVGNADGSERRILIAGEVLGFSWQPVVEAPSIDPPPTGPTAPSPTAGIDVGLGYVLCDVNLVGHGPFVESGGSVYLGFELVDGECPVEPGMVDPSGPVRAVVGIDVDGDERFDAAVDGLTCSAMCTSFTTPDVDGDGLQELLIQNVQFSIAGLQLIDFATDVEGGPIVATAIIAPPGDPGNGFVPGESPQLWLGGDAFELDGLDCQDGPDGRVLVISTANQEPPDSVDSVWKVHETVLRLTEVGVLEIVSTRDYEEPVGQDPSYYGNDTLCGAEIPAPYSGD